MILAVDILSMSQRTVPAHWQGHKKNDRIVPLHQVPKKIQKARAVQMR